MRGIAGTVRWDGRDETAAVETMIGAMSHRGPDAGPRWRPDVMLSMAET